MNINPDHLSTALRQIGIILAATGLITGIIDPAQTLNSATITTTGMALILAGSLEN